MKQNGLVGIEDIVARDEKVRTEERLATMRVLENDIRSAFLATSKARDVLEGLVRTLNGDTNVTQAELDAPAPKRRKAVAVTPERENAVAMYLLTLGGEESCAVKPSDIAANVRLGLKTIAAACKQLVKEGRATEHRGRYRLVENRANPPIPDEVFVGNEDEHGDRLE